MATGEIVERYKFADIELLIALDAPIREFQVVEPCGAILIRTYELSVAREYIKDYVRKTLMPLVQEYKAILADLMSDPLEKYRTLINPVPTGLED